LRARHGPEKIPVLRADFFKNGDLRMGRAAKKMRLLSRFLSAAIIRAAKNLPMKRSKS